MPLTPGQAAGVTTAPAVQTDPNAPPQNFLPAPIVNAPTPQPAPPQGPSTGATGTQPSLFRRLLLGALSGIAAPAQQAQADIADTQARTAALRQETQNAQAQAGYDSQRANDQHQLALMQIQSIPDERLRDKAENAYYQTRAAIAAKQLATMPANAQEQSLQDLDSFSRSAVLHGASFYEAGTDAGFTPSQAGTYTAAMTLVQRLNDRDANSSSGAGFHYFIGSWVGAGGKRQFGAIAVPGANDPGAVSTKPTTITLSDGSRFVFPKGTKNSVIVKAELDTTLKKIDRAHADEVNRRTSQAKALTDSINELSKQKDMAGNIPPAIQSKITVLQNRRAGLLGLAPVVTPSGASTPAPNQIPEGATVATNKAGQKIYTTDGGKTWIDPSTQRPLQ